MHYTCRVQASLFAVSYVESLLILYIYPSQRIIQQRDSEIHVLK
jgi:hypothetical protein